MKIKDKRFGIPGAGFPIERTQTDFGPIGNLVRPFVCENGTYRIVSGIFDVTERASTAPIHAFFVDSEGHVRDRASLVGRVNIDRTTGEAEHRIVDRGTCHQTANLNLGPNTDQATVFGPFFVLPFNTTVVTP